MHGHEESAPMDADKTLGTYGRTTGGDLDRGLGMGAPDGVPSMENGAQSRRRTAGWRGALVCACLGIVAGGCQSTGVIGATDCWAVLEFETRLEPTAFHLNGVHAKVLDPDCPLLTKVECIFYEDRDRNGRLDPGEPVTARPFVESNPPSQTLTVGSLSGRRAGAGRPTCWECVAQAENGLGAKFGGSF
jgi:hypothetical protein